MPDCYLPPKEMAKNNKIVNGFIIRQVRLFVHCPQKVVIFNYVLIRSTMLTKCPAI